MPLKSVPSGVAKYNCLFLLVKTAFILQIGCGEEGFILQTAWGRTGTMGPHFVDSNATVACCVFDTFYPCSQALFLGVWLARGDWRVMACAGSISPKTGYKRMVTIEILLRQARQHHRKLLVRAIILLKEFCVWWVGSGEGSGSKV